MDIRYKQALLEQKTDLDNALARVAGSEDIYERLLKKFLSDPNFSGLKTCLIAKKYEDAFVYAHTLKGLSGNLGLNPVYESVHPIVELLRNNKGEEASGLFPSLEHEYHDLCDIIRNYT